jgi:hypothetical protein
MYVSYITDQPGVSLRHSADALALIIVCGVLTRLTYAYVMLCQDDVAPGQFYLFECVCQYQF